jgi:uncharacterized protein
MLEQNIQADYIKAMKDRDAVKSGTLSFLRSQLKNVMIDKRQDQLADADVIAVIKKQIKQRQDSIEQYEKGSRMDLAEKEKKELAILKAYLPEEMSADQLNPVIAAAIKEAQATGMKDMGAVMKIVVSQVAGKADNKMVSTLVREALAKL